MLQARLRIAIAAVLFERVQELVGVGMYSSGAQGSLALRGIETPRVFCERLSRPVFETSGAVREPRVLLTAYDQGVGWRRARQRRT